MTYEVIMERLLSRVESNYPDLDRREGSIIFNALAPAAMELAMMYVELDITRSESFVNTATREYILQGCKDMGMDISIFSASVGTHKAEFDVEVPIGSRWSCDLYNYEVIELIEQNEETNYYEYKMLCESPGTEPNNVTGELTPITDTPLNLTYAKLTECLIEGENETSDEDVKSAYYEYVNSTKSDGNVNQYKQWCEEFVTEEGSRGIGNYKIVPLWNGANTVKVSILSSSNRIASEELIAEFQEYLDPNSEGMGNGVAPIGAIVTVTTATELPINITATVTMQSGYTDTTSINTALANYFSEIAYKKNQVAYMNVGSAILAAEGVDSVSNVTINGGTADITLSDEQIPVLGTTNWTVVN
jgi:uncharacterized phage protein gp47/JayE